jgi:Recombination enhancement, RecA-dependent nuclease
MGPSKSPTKSEREWMDRARSVGCLACEKDGQPGTPAEIHHITDTGRRLGHLFTIPLCPWHHRDGGESAPAVHPFRRRFEQKYGAQIELLIELQVRLGIYDEVRHP